MSSIVYAMLHDVYKLCCFGLSRYHVLRNCWKNLSAEFLQVNAYYALQFEGIFGLMYFSPRLRDKSGRRPGNEATKTAG